ncbi:MAG: FeoA family protein [Bacteriovoracaceae bacterium]
MKLSDIPNGTRVRVVKFVENMSNVSTLLGLGIIPGDELTVINKALSGGPILIRHGESSFFALRANEANLIEIEVL